MSRTSPALAGSSRYRGTHNSYFSHNGVRAVREADGKHLPHSWTIGSKFERTTLSHSSDTVGSLVLDPATAFGEKRAACLGRIGCFCMATDCSRTSAQGRYKVRLVPTGPQ